jgi:hypothetical protein
LKLFFKNIHADAKKVHINMPPFNKRVPVTGCGYEYFLADKLSHKSRRNGLEFIKG